MILTFVCNVSLFTFFLLLFPNILQLNAIHLFSHSSSFRLSWHCRKYFRNNHDFFFMQKGQLNFWVPDHRFWGLKPLPENTYAKQSIFVWIILLFWWFFWFPALKKTHKYFFSIYKEKKPNAQAAGADSSLCNYKNRQNPPIQQNFWIAFKI